MGHFKPDGRCWSGECQKIGRMRCGQDEDGRVVMLCEPCRDRISRAFKAEAQRVALEMCEMPANQKELH